MPNGNGFTTVARKYLDARRTVLWANWNLSDTDDKERAVAWLADVFAEAFRPEPDLP